MASNPAAGGDPSGAFDPLAVIGRGEIERSGQQSPGVRQEPAPQRLPATVAVERQALSIRALSGRVRRAAVPLAVAGGPVHTRAGWAWCAVAGLLLLLTTLATAPAHAQGAGICGRTVEVRDAIVALIPDVDNCADVTADHLGANRHAVAERQRRHLPCGGGFRRADRTADAGFVEERADGASRRGVRWADLVAEALGDVVGDAVEYAVEPVREDIAAFKKEVKEDVTGVKEDIAIVKEDIAIVKGDLAVFKEDVAQQFADLSRSSALDRVAPRGG